MFFDILCHLSHNSPNPATRAFPICHCRLLSSPNASRRNGLIQCAVIPESQLNGGLWDAEVPFLSNLFIYINWHLFLINGWVDSTETKWRGNWPPNYVPGWKEKGDQSRAGSRKWTLQSITTLLVRLLLLSMEWFVCHAWWGACSGESKSPSVVPDSADSPWNSPGQNIGVIAIPFSRGSFQPKDRTQVSCIAGRCFMV